jgi:hypothetical protein
MTEALMLGGDAIGTIETPRGWEVTTGIWLREPESRCENAALTVKSAQHRPRALISIRCERSSAGAEEAMKQWLATFTEQVAAKVLRTGTATFTDGAAGCFALISFDVGPNGRATQCHLFRADAGVVTELTASVAEHQLPRIERELLPMLLAFRRNA